VNNLGVTNHLLGFTLFAYGIGMLLVHVGLCCKSKDWNRKWFIFWNYFLYFFYL